MIKCYPVLNIFLASVLSESHISGSSGPGSFSCFGNIELNLFILDIRF